MHLEPLLSLRDGGAREAGADRTSRDRTRLAFDQFEPIDVSISRASTPGQGQSCQDGIFVLLNADDKRRKGFEPGLKLFSGALTHHVQKRFYQVVGGLSLWAGLSKPPKVREFFFLQVGSPAEKEPGGLLRRERKARIGRLEGATCVGGAAAWRETSGNAEGSNTAR